jgi:hypothetical protein
MTTLLVGELKVGMIVETPNDGFCKIIDMATAETDQIIRIFHLNKENRKACFSRKVTKLIAVKIDEAVDEERKRNECYKKKAIRSMETAIRRAKEITATGCPMRAYQCTVCYEWHLTSQV